MKKLEKLGAQTTNFRVIKTWSSQEENFEKIFRQISLPRHEWYLPKNKFNGDGKLQVDAFTVTKYLGGSQDEDGMFFLND